MMKIESTKRAFPMFRQNRSACAMKILLAAGLIAYLFTSGRLDVGAIFTSYKRPGSLALGALCCTLAIVTPIFRWSILTFVQKLPLGSVDAFRLTMIGYFFQHVYPWRKRRRRNTCGLFCS
jgi:hypothetical protein